MTITNYSIVWSIMLFTAGIITGHILLKKGDYRLRFAAGFLFLLAFCRLLLPMKCLRGYYFKIHFIYPQICRWLCKSFNRELSIGEILLALWGISFLGALCALFARQLVQFYHIRNLPSVSRDSKIFTVCQEVKSELDCRKEPELYTCSHISGILSVGFHKPVILLPSYASQLSDEELRHIFCHELYHYINCDLWIKLLLELFICIFWWNPAVYLLRDSLEQTLELRCDKCVCRHYSMEERYYYAKTLQQILYMKKKEKEYFAMGCCGSNSGEYLLQRMKYLLNEEKKASPLRVCIIILAALFMFWASYHLVPQPVGMPPINILKCHIF